MWSLWEVIHFLTSEVRTVWTENWCEVGKFGSRTEAVSLLETGSDLPQAWQVSMGTSSSAMQTDPVLRDDRTSTEECCSSALQSQLAQTIPHLTAKPSGTGLQDGHPPVSIAQCGLQKAAGQGRILTASARSFRAQPRDSPGRRWAWKTAGAPQNGSTEPCWQQQEALSMWD